MERQIARQQAERRNSRAPNICLPAKGLLKQDLRGNVLGSAVGRPTGGELALESRRKAKVCELRRAHDPFSRDEQIFRLGETGQS